MSRLLSTDTNHLAVEAGYYGGDMGGCKEWLYDEHNILVNAYKYVHVDYMEDDMPEEYGYSFTTSDYNNIISVHDGTGAAMPEHWHGEGYDYWEAFDLGLRKGVEIVLKKYKDGNV